MSGRHPVGSRAKYSSSTRQMVQRGTTIRRLTDREKEEFRERIAQILAGNKRPYYGTI